jgi:hypothetical protein
MGWKKDVEAGNNPTGMMNAKAKSIEVPTLFIPEEGPCWAALWPMRM